MSFLWWFRKPKPNVWYVPGVGPKPLKDFTDKDIEAAARPFQERAERLRKPVQLDFFRLVLLAREEERESRSVSRLGLGLSEFREWLAWQLWYRWCYRGGRESEPNQIVVDLAGDPALERWFREQTRR